MVGFNGENWTVMNGEEAWKKTAKYVLLAGIYEGMGFGRSPDFGRLPQNVTWETVVDGVDQFYADAINRQVEIVAALQILALKMAGKPQSEIDRALRVARCQGSAMADYASVPVEQASRMRNCSSIP
jgi:hypothetical protein